MNIIEALNSGRRFKRPCYSSWLPAGHAGNYAKIDILADDWEIEEETLTVTISELTRVMYEVESHLRVDIEDVIQKLKAGDYR